MTLYNLAWQLSNTINPVLVALLLEEPLLSPATETGRRERWPVFWIRSAASIAVAVVLAESGKRYVVLAGHPTFPSGHMTFAAAAATCLVLRRGPRWLLLVAPLVLAIGASLVLAGWHRPVDVVGGLVLGTGVSWLGNMILTAQGARLRVTEPGLDHAGSGTGDFRGSP